jgi:VanZ family protein
MDDRRFGTRWTAVAVGTVVLLTASLLPSPFGRHPSWRRIGPDKFLHFVGHAGYAVVLADAFGAGGWSDGEAAVVAVCVSTAHGLLTGRLQTLVPGRAFEPADVVAGVLGSLLAALWWLRHAGRESPPSHR